MKHEPQSKDRPDAEPKASDCNPRHENWKSIGDLARRLVEKAVRDE